MYLVPPAHSLSLLFFFFFFFFIFLLLLVHAIFHAPLLAVFADGLNDWLSAHLQQAIYEALQVLQLISLHSTPENFATSSDTPAPTAAGGSAASTALNQFLLDAK